MQHLDPFAAIVIAATDWIACCLDQPSVEQTIGKTRSIYFNLLNLHSGSGICRARHLCWLAS